jgi:hypothetical protein
MVREVNRAPTAFGRCSSPPRRPFDPDRDRDCDFAFDRGCDFVSAGEFEFEFEFEFPFEFGEGWLRVLVLTSRSSTSA